MKRILLLVLIFLLVGCNQDSISLDSVIKQIEIKTFEVIETDNGFEPGGYLYSTIENYDSDGLLIETIKMNVEGSVISRYVKEYDKKGRMIHTISYYDFDKPRGTTDYIYENDLLMRTEHFGRYELESYTTYEYFNQQDNIKITYDKEGTVISTSEEIHETEFKTRAYYNYEKSDSRASFEYVKDELGNLIELRYFDENDRLITETLTEYDNYNNRIKTVSVDINPRLETLNKNNTSSNITSVSVSSNFVGEYKYEYDKVGNYVLSMIYFDGILEHYEERVIEYWK